MKVVILGCGAVGSVLAKLLAKEKDVTKVICGDIRFNFKIKNRKIVLKYLDFLEKSKFLKFLKKTKPDVVVFIKIRMIEDTGSKEIVFSWNKDWLLDELATKPLVYYNKKFKVVEPFTGEEEYTFPKPIGKKKVVLFCQDEVGSIPLHIKTKNLDVKIHDNNIDISKFLVELGLASNN